MPILQDPLETDLRRDGKAARLKETATPNMAKTLTEAPEAALQSLPERGVPGYELLEEVGRGSMGVVYKARQNGVNRLVALKMILTSSHANREVLQRFTVEARVVASLQHPNIVQLFEINLESDRPYFSMELVQGGTLADRLGGCPQPSRQSAQMVLTLARAIHFAHQSGVIHRDLKPANILLAAQTTRNSHVERLIQEMDLLPTELTLGIPKITDFGLAKEMHASGGQTESGMILGTPSYMAPEQAEGKSRDVGPRADIYALGAIFYEMLTGRPPFAAESPMETILLLFQTEPVPPSHLQPKIPRDLETIALKCLQKDPQRRYDSAEELADDLQRYLSGEDILAKPAPLHEKAWKWMKRRPALATLAVAMLFAVAGFLGLLVWHQGDLQAQLGKALGDEREARQSQEEAGERERVAQSLDRLKEFLHSGEAALAAQDWNAAREQLNRAFDQASSEPALADWQSRIEQLLRQASQQRQDHERLAQFTLRYNEALFQATLYTGADLASSLRETRTTVLEALALFGVDADSMAGPDVDSPYYTDRQKAEITTACYELLFVLADAAIQPRPDQPGIDKKGQAEEALRILDLAKNLDAPTQAYHFRRARYLAQAGRGEDSEAERLHAELLKPTTALDHFLLGQEQYRKGDFKQAIQAFESALQVQPDHFWGSYYLALCWLKTQRPNQAATSLTACLSQRRDFPWLYLLRASAWSEMGQFDRAEADFGIALQANLPDAARYGLLINRGVQRIRQGLLDSAKADLQQAIALRPNQYQGYANLAQAYLKGEQAEEALKQLDEAIRCEPTLPVLHRTRSRVNLLLDDPNAALADLDRTLQLSATTAPELFGEDHLERAKLLHRLKRNGEAILAYDAALSLLPTDVRVGRGRAEVLWELKRLPEALQSLDNCVKFGPPDKGVFLARALLRMRSGQYSGAQTDYSRALEIDPDAATYAARGWCFLVADAPRLALPDFVKALHLAPKQADALAGRGYARVLLGDYQKAVLDAEESEQLGPPSPRLCFNLARIYAQAIARLDIENPRGAAKLRGVWHDRAVKMLAQALALQPSAEAADFWQTVILTDRALSPLRNSPEFGHLATRFSQKQ